MSKDLSDILDNIEKENLLFVVLSGISIGGSVSSRYGDISRLSETRFEIAINKDLTLERDDSDDGDPDRSLRSIFG